MKSRAVRLTLFLLFVIAIGAAASLFYLGETRIRGGSETARAYDARVIEIMRGVDQLRASQLAYVAAGQGDQFWAEKVTAGLASLQSGLEALHAASTAADAQASVDNARAILEDFSQMDRRARQYTGNGQRLLASDLIFSDGLELTNAGVEAVRLAGVAERQAQEEVVEGERRRQVYALGSGAAAALLVTLLLLPTARRDEPEGMGLRAPLRVVADGPEDRIRPETPVADVPVEEDWSRAEARAPAHDDVVVTSAPVPALPPPAPPVELGSLAALCTDLARLSDTRALPGLLERAAGALDASGIILWIADPDGQELAPIVTHGYAPLLITRLGNIRRDDQNATAAALRTSLLQTVNADAVSEGAIAAPLVTPAGCVGVMAAEVKHAGEQDPARLAIATIVAAQLATMVGPPSSKARAEATG